MPAVHIIRLYRVSPGDVDVPDTISPAEQAESTTIARLEVYFEDGSRPPHLRPHHADIVDASGNVVASYMVDFSRRAKKVEVRNA